MSVETPLLPPVENDFRYMAVAVHIGTWSKDRSKGVGAIIVAQCGTIVSSGVNDFPQGVSSTQNDRHARPAKYLWTEHAERNAIFGAARIGIPLAGTRMYTQRFPCAECARAIAQSGISRVVCPEWRESADHNNHDVAVTILRESGVFVTVLSLPSLWIEVPVDGSQDLTADRKGDRAPHQ